MADTPLWTVDELLAATGGKLVGEPRAPIGGVSIDSRNIQAGDIFVAIKGENRDGHDFVPASLKAGAALALVSRTSDEMRSAGPLLEVADDPLRGLENLGRYARARSYAQVIAITGSVGKTSSKEMLRVAFSASGLTHASAASYNNHWGVPLTLARMPRETAYGVFEIGMNHAGEITPLTRMVKPHIAIITTVAPVHLGQFASMDEIADAKAEIFSGLEPDGHAVINRDTPYFERLAKAAHVSVVGFGRDPQSEARLERVVLHETCCCITADIMGDKLIYKLGVPGEHMAINSLGVLAAVKLAGADLARGALALAHAEPVKGRGQRQHLSIAGGELLLIDESYNANPASVRAALSLLGQTRPGRGGRRIAVLGDMLELGKDGPALHAGLADAVEAAEVDVVYGSGPLMAHLLDAIPAHRRGARAEAALELRDPVIKGLAPGDVIMVKGSLGSRMGPLVEAIRGAFPPVAKDP